MKSQTQNMAFNISQVFFYSTKTRCVKVFDQEIKVATFSISFSGNEEKQKAKTKTKQRKQTEEVFAVNET